MDVQSYDIVSSTKRLEMAFHFAIYKTVDNLLIIDARIFWWASPDRLEHTNGFKINSRNLHLWSVCRIFP
jgi:hypothetical protein